MTAQSSLFECERAMQDLWGVIARINAKCGVDTVYMAPMHGERGAAPRRIPFGKPPDLRLADLEDLSTSYSRHCNWRPTR